MSLVNSTTRQRPVSQLLGIVSRSIGYLQGGYKGTTIQSAVQQFNTVNQTGRIVYDTGYQQSYKPGLSGNHAGYFSIDNLGGHNKFSYVTSTASSSFSTVIHPQTTASDFNVYTVGWILGSVTGAAWGAYPADSWTRVNLANDTPINYGSLSTAAMCTTRQGGATGLCAVFINTDYTGLTVLNYSTNAITSNAGNSTLMNSGAQIPCGMCRDNSATYIIGFTPFNMKVSLSGTTITALSQETAFTYNFGESHSVTSATDGYMMAGYSDTTGRYDSTQHGLCQKITFSNSAITTLADLVLPQSSGQMMQGF